MRLASVAALACLLAGPAVAQTPAAPPPGAQQGRPIFRLRTFDDLVRVCDTSASDQDYENAESLCSGYVAGVLADHKLESERGRPEVKVCMAGPMSVTASMGQEMAAWARQNARNGEEPAAQGVVRFFVATRPCP